jgi:G6PDH family F420-dependent oxidoreductase
MADVGIFLSSEEHGPRELLTTAQHAEAAGFRAAWISDHYHPWTDRQGHSPFVWSVIGGIAASTDLRVTTAVTCPTFRIHPAVLAQAAATTAAMMPGRFALGVGSGEALNEHILGQHWPPADVRLGMLREAIEVMRALWTGEIVNHRGEAYCVENARLYTLPEDAVPVMMSAFGPKATELAAEIADGFISTHPDAELLGRYRELGGKGPAAGGTKVCWGPDEGKARKLAHELWASSSVPGELSQELPMPAHFEQGAQLVTEDDVAESIVCGPDPERHAEAITAFFEAGFDEVYVSQVGPDQDGFLDFFTKEVRPRLDR